MCRLLCIFLCCFSVAAAQDLAAYEKHFYNAPELVLPYRYLRPITLDSNKAYPLIIFLHGALQKGFDNEAQLRTGARYFLRDSIRNNYPAFVLFPQCPQADLWAYFENKAGDEDGMKFPFPKKPTEASAVLMKLVDSLVKRDRIDASRIYIGGLSQGGMGVLDLLARFPERFAAGFSICGAGNVSTAKRFAGKSALWLFHGSDDDVIPVNYSRRYYKFLQNAGSDVRYSEYPGVLHDSWNNAFGEADLMRWIFSKNRN